MKEESEQEDAQTEKRKKKKKKKKKKEKEKSRAHSHIKLLIDIQKNTLMGSKKRSEKQEEKRRKGRKRDKKGTVRVHNGHHGYPKLGHQIQHLDQGSGHRGSLKVPKRSNFQLLHRLLEEKRTVLHLQKNNER